MGTLHTRPYGFQIRVTNKLTPKDLWTPFDTRGAAEQYMHQLDALLDQGIVPAALLERSNVRRTIWTVQRCVVEYVLNDAVPPFRPKADGHDHVPAVFLIGIGVIANLLLDMLARSGVPCKIVLAAHNDETAYRRAMLAQLVQATWGRASLLYKSRPVSKVLKEFSQM
ncbi:MAG: hypothetical protein JWP34_2265 [Massilia sp.]|jgi:hypothetical protein|nr:hypothetical protein [Massilia sp.]